MNHEQRSEATAPREVVRAFVEAVNRKDWDAITSLIAPDFRRHSAQSGPPTLSGRDALLDFLRQELQIFPDAQETIEDVVGEGNKVAVRHRFSGTQAGAIGDLRASGRRAVADYIAIYRIEDAMIAEAWVAWDNLSILRQLGHA